MQDPANGGGLADLVGRDFVPDAKDNLWFGDITYIFTMTGWVYLATVIDGFSRRMVGWAVADHMREELVIGALQMAVANRKPGTGEVVFHSDRGSQYTGHEFRSACLSNGIIPSVGNTGVCFDNAAAQCRLIRLRGGGGGSWAESRAGCSSACVVSWGRLCAASVLPPGGRCALCGLDSVSRRFRQSFRGLRFPVSEGEKAACPETWRRTTRSARMKDILSGSRSAWSAASLIRCRIP